MALGTLDLTDNSVTVWPLTEAIVEGNIYEWEAWSGSGTTANMYAQKTFSGDAFLTLENNHPADPPSSQNRSMRLAGSNPTSGATSSQPSLTNLWRGPGDDDQNLYVNQSRSVATQQRMFRLVLTAPAGTTAGQSSGSVRTRQEIITTRFGLTEYDTGTLWTSVGSIGVPMTAISKDNMDRVEIIVRIASQFEMPLVITGDMMRYAGATTDPLPSGLGTGIEVPGVYLSARDTTASDSREPLVIRPVHNWIDGRRQAGRAALLISFGENADGDWALLRFHVSSDVQVDIERAAAISWE